MVQTKWNYIKYNNLKTIYALKNEYDNGRYIMINNDIMQITFDRRKRTC